MKTVGWRVLYQMQNLTSFENFEAKKINDVVKEWVTSLRSKFCWPAARSVQQQVPGSELWAWARPASSLWPRTSGWSLRRGRAGPRPAWPSRTSTRPSSSGHKKTHSSRTNQRFRVEGWWEKFSGFRDCQLFKKKSNAGKMAASRGSVKVEPFESRTKCCILQLL